MQVKFAKVFAPVIVETLEPVNATVPLVPALNVPVLVQLPLRLIDPVLVCSVPTLVTSPSTFRTLVLILNVWPKTMFSPAACERFAKEIMLITINATIVTLAFILNPSLFLIADRNNNMLYQFSLLKNLSACALHADRSIMSSVGATCL